MMSHMKNDESNVGIKYWQTIKSNSALQWGGCPVCPEYYSNTAAKLKEHMSMKHFPQEIWESYNLHMTDWCPIDNCNKEFLSKMMMVRHIGSTHDKVLEILVLSGFQLPRVFVESRKRSWDEMKETKPSRN